MTCEFPVFRDNYHVQSSGNYMVILTRQTGLLLKSVSKMCLISLISSLVFLQVFAFVLLFLRLTEFKSSMTKNFSLV